MKKKSLTIGDSLPKIAVETDTDGSIDLSDLKGKVTILYFYPKDNTSGCTKQACSFQDELKIFKKAGAQIIGVSPDSIESHKKFRTKFDLEFPLISDVDKKLANLFGVWVEKSMYGRKYMGIQRSTFLIDRKGKIVKIWEKVKVDGHVAEVLETIQSLK